MVSDHARATRQFPMAGMSSPEGFFFSSPTHLEAFARMLFLVEQNRRVGLVLGARGYGKTRVLEVILHDLRSRGIPAASVGLAGLEPRELLWELASQLGSHPQPGDSTHELWRQVAGRLAAHAYEQLPTVVLLDDVDEASADVRGQVTRLARIQVAPATRATLVLAAQHAARLEPGLLDLVDLRTDLEPWDAQETARFLDERLEPAGLTMSSDAATRLHELSRGVPRRVVQLADLALLATSGEHGLPVDAGLIESVYTELLTTP